MMLFAWGKNWPCKIRLQNFYALRAQSEKTTRVPSCLVKKIWHLATKEKKKTFRHVNACAGIWTRIRRSNGYNVTEWTIWALNPWKQPPVAINLRCWVSKWSGTRNSGLNISHGASIASVFFWTYLRSILLFFRCNWNLIIYGSLTKASWERGSYFLKKTIVGEPQCSRRDLNPEHVVHCHHSSKLEWTALPIDSPHSKGIGEEGGVTTRCVKHSTSSFFCFLHKINSKEVLEPMILLHYNPSNSPNKKYFFSLQLFQLYLDTVWWQKNLWIQILPSQRIWIRYFEICDSSSLEYLGAQFFLTRNKALHQKSQ